jgi:hypothetical protein
MRRITPWIIGAPSLVVILLALLSIVTIWGARTFLAKSVDIGLEGIITVIHSGEATLDRIDNIVSVTLPTSIIAVESMLEADPEQSLNVNVIQEKALLHIRAELLPEIDQLIHTTETITQIILSANETLLHFNTLPFFQLPPLPANRWQAINNRLPVLRDGASGLLTLLTRTQNNGLIISESEIWPNIQKVQNISQELKVKLVKIKADLSTILERIQTTRNKISNWITWSIIGFYLVMLWVAGGQIYLLWHFWKTRSIRV